MRLRASRLLVTLISPLILTACSGGYVSTRIRSAGGSRTGKSVVVTPARYVGTSTCIECHSDEGKACLASPHMRTLRLMNRADLGTLAPDVGSIPKGRTALVLDPQTGRYAARVTGQGGRSYPLQLAFGSGKHGITYVEIRGNRVGEYRWTYFPKLKEWHTTPGSEDLPPGAFGDVRTPSNSRDCIGCHTISVSQNQLMPRASFFGVGCEACHGPGSNHVSAMQVGESQKPSIADLSGWTAERLNEMCGKCHGTAQNLGVPIPTPMLTSRFQPYGLMLSRCFLEGGQTLSCITCHDPHEKASSDLRHYEKVCLSCHSPAAEHAQYPLPSGAIRGKTCPVNPVSGCISCHMPENRVFPDTTIKMTMPDHWIHVPRKG